MQDGVLAEPGRRADGSPAEPLATLTARATQTMLDVHGFRIKMIEKPFHVTTRDDPAILEIVKGLAHPLDPADMPRRPVIAQVGDTPIRRAERRRERSGQVLDFSNTSSHPLSPFRLVSAGSKASK